MTNFQLTSKYLLTAFFAFTLFLSAFSFANAATYYIATSADGGFNSNSGTISQPWATFSYAFGEMSGGDTLFVRGGTYGQNIKNPPSGTSWSNATTIKTYNNEKVTLNPTTERVIDIVQVKREYIIIDGFILDGVGINHTPIYIKGTAWGNGPIHIRLVSIEAKDSANLGSGFGISSYTDDIQMINTIAHGNGGGGAGTHSGYYLSGRNLLVDGCIAYGQPGSRGVTIFMTSERGMSNITIRNCKTYGNQRGIGVYTGYGHKIYNNVSFNNSMYGIEVNKADNEVYNNTVYNNGEAGIRTDDNAVNTIIRNNIIYDNGTPIDDDGSGTIKDHNLCESGCDFSGDPKFIDPSDPVGPDNIWGTVDDGFQLQAGSPAIDAGTSNVGGLFNTDILGNTRPSGDGWDIGAYEYGGTIEPPPTCTDFTYTDWLPTICPISEIQTKEVATSLPQGCTGGNPETFTQSCEYIPGQGPTITTNKTSYTPNETINVTVNNGNSNVEEWISLYVASNLDSAWGVAGMWQTLNGTKTNPTTPLPYPVPLSFTAPTTEGTYNMRYFGNDNNGNKIAQSPNFTVTNIITLRGDLDQNGTVNTLDWSIMNANWGTSNSTADINNDGIVNTIDFSIMNGEWGQSV